MKIGLIARLHQPITSQAPGYYYKLYYLILGLKQKGHQVFVLAHPQSKVPCKLVPAKFKHDSWESALCVYRGFIEKYSGQLDIINAHTDHLACYLDGYSKVPLVHNIIFSRFWGQVEEALYFYRKQNFIAISHSAKKRYPYLNWQGVAYNGINLEDFPLCTKKENFLVYMAQVVEYKGVLDAIKAAKETKNKLIIAGPCEEPFFTNKIKPLLNKNISYAGDLNFKQKIKLLKNAKALLHPHQTPEAFGNSMIEAQACGTPVIAYAPGSTAEVIKDKKTGFVVDDYTGMVAAIAQIDSIDSGACRRFVEENFSYQQMASAYEKIYQKILNR